MKAQSLINSMEQLSSEVEGLGANELPQYLRDEVGDIIAEFFEEVYLLGDISNLEMNIINAKKIDKNAILEALQIIEKANPSEYALIISDERKIDVNPKEIINKMKDYLSKVTDFSNRLSVQLMLELSCDSDFKKILISFDPKNKIFKELHKLVLKKVKLIDSDTILLLWSELKRSFSQKRDGGFVNYKEIIPEKFWDNNLTVDEIRNYYTNFIVKYEPFVIKKMVESGLLSHPISVPGVAKILAINETGKLLRVTRLQEAIVRILSHIVTIYEKLTATKKESLAKSVGITSEDSLVFSGEYYDNYLQSVSELKAYDKNLVLVLISKMKRLYNYVLELHTSFSNEAQALWHYKLGQEIIAPKRTSEIKRKKGKKEIELQKEICKFLVERNIYAYGKLFGRSIIDLYIRTEGGDDLIVETKIYKNPVSEKLLKTHITQLKSYMDQHSQPRGVLAIYNCTNDTIISPKGWLGGRIWILAINIGDSSPSKRKRSIEIKFTNDSNGFFIEDIDARRC